MAYQKYFEDADIAGHGLELEGVPEEILAKPPIAEDKFVIKNEAGKHETLKVMLYHDVLAICKADGSTRYLNLSFMRANYVIEDNSSMKYRIDLMKLNSVVSLHTDKLERVQKWMESLSKFCINYTFFKKYTVGEQIGQGAFGKVFKVSLNNDPCQVFAAKIFEKKSVKKLYKKLMVAEIQVLQMLHHENIIKIEEVHETPDEVVVVMELMNCGLLSDYIKENPKMSPHVIRQIMHQLLQGLAYMASMGVIHRDIKPSNILIEKFEKVGAEKVPIIKIADVGLACFEGQKQLFEAAGTPGFMAPEVILSGKLTDMEPLTSKLDVYSAGVLFYWLITKRSPFKTSDDGDVGKANEIGKIAYDSMYITKFSKAGIDLLRKMLEPKTKIRISAKDALEHAYFFEADGSTALSAKTSGRESISPSKILRKNESIKNNLPFGESGLLQKAQFKKMRSKSFN